MRAVAVAQEEPQPQPPATAATDPLIRMRELSHRPELVRSAPPCPTNSPDAAARCRCMPLNPMDGACAQVMRIFQHWRKGILQPPVPFTPTLVGYHLYLQACYKVSE